MSANATNPISRTYKERTRRLARVAPPALALFVVGVAATYQLVPASAFAAQVSEPTDMERFGGLLEAGYNTDTLLAAGVTPGAVNSFYTGAMGEADSIDAAVAALAALRGAKSELEDINSGIRRFGLSAARDSERTSARAAVENAEQDLAEAEAYLADAISQGLSPQVSDRLSVLTSRRAWAVPIAWRLVDLGSDAAIERAERLAAALRTDPNAGLSQSQATLLASITGNAMVSAASFRIESGSDAARQAMMEYLSALQGSE